MYECYSIPVVAIKFYFKIHSNRLKYLKKISYMKVYTHSFITNPTVADYHIMELKNHKIYRLKNMIFLNRLKKIPGIAILK